MILTTISETLIKECPGRFNECVRDDTVHLPPIFQPTAFSKWKHLLPFGKDIRSINITAYVPILLEIMKSTVITGKILQTHREATEDLVHVLNANFERPSFIRLDFNSLKDAMDVTLPIRSGEEVVRSILLSIRSMCFLNFQVELGEDVFLHLLPFMPIDPEDELRCFIYNDRLTAISQYVWHKDLSLGSCINLELITEKIMALNEQLKDQVPNMKSRVMDVAICDDGNDVRLLEFNPFSPYCCGCALYSWELDHDRLFGKMDDIEFRIVV